MKKYLPLALLALLLIVTAISTYKLNKTQENEKSNQVLSTSAQQIVPEFVLDDLFEEKKFEKKDLLGKYSIINFFASWCTTCAAEHETLLRLQSQKVIDIYGVAWRDISENTKHFLQEIGNPYIRVFKDSQGKFGENFNIEAVPETILIGPKGEVLARYRGNLQDPEIEEIKSLMRPVPDKE